MLSSESIRRIDLEVAKYPADQKQSAVMSALAIAQDEHGWLSVALMDEVARHLGMPPVAVYEVATFYTMYNLKPQGRFKVTICTNLPCALSGANEAAAHLKSTLGDAIASRFVSAEKLVADFRSHRVASEIVAFGEAANIAIQLTERALSNEVITPGKTTLEDVAWWMQDQLLDRALGSEFDMPSVYVTGPSGIVATSNSRIIQPGDVMMIDWGVQLMNFGTDVKRVAYVLKPGEVMPPKSIQNAFDKALTVRDVVKKAIKVGIRADETMKNMDAALKAAGFGVIEFNRPNKDDRTDVVYGFHPVGNTGHDIGPSLTTWQPLQTTFVMHAQHMFSFEYFAYTPIAEWGGAKLRVPIEDDAILTEAGIQFLHPANYRLLVIK